MLQQLRLPGIAALVVLTLTTLPQCNPAPKNNKGSTDSSLKNKDEPPKWTAPKILLDRELWSKASPEDQDKAIQAAQKQLGSDYAFVETKVYEAGGQKHRIPTLKHVKTGILLNLIPGGTYQMGSNEKIQEKPIHKVTIKPMLVGKYEVTQAQWQAFMKVNRAKSKGADKPIVNLSIQECQSWLAAAGGELRLPSESEWEYACRSGTSTKYFWGDEMDSDYCWYSGNSEISFPVTKHANKTNAFGLADMSGNASEFCEDGWTDNYKKAPSDHSPQRGERFARITRGGAVGMSAIYCRSANRHSAVARAVWNGTGFRVFKSLD